MIALREMPLPILPAMKDANDQNMLVRNDIDDDMGFIEMKPDRRVEFGSFTRGKRMVTQCPSGKSLSHWNRL